MALTLDTANLIADLAYPAPTPNARDLRDRISMETIEPFRDDITAYLASAEYGDLVRNTHINPKRLADVLRTPVDQVRTVPGLFAWMRTNQRGPFTVVPQGDSIPPEFRNAVDYGRMSEPEVPGHNGHEARMAIAGYIHTHLDQWRDLLTEWVTAHAVNVSQTDLGAVLDPTAPPSIGLLWLPDFAHWYINRTPTTTPEAPMTAEIAEFRRRYGIQPRNTNPRESSMSTGNDGDNVQAAFLALPEQVRDLWRDTYNTAVRNDLFAFGGVPDFDRGGVGITSYGFSTENFFRYTRQAGITIGDNGGPVLPGDATVPQGDAATTLVFDPDQHTDVTVRAAFARGENVFAPVEALFRAWAGRRGTSAAWATYILTGNNTDDWDGRDTATWDRYWHQNGTGAFGQGFLQYLREHRAEIPTVTAPAVPQGDSIPAIARLIDAGTLNAAALHGAARFALLAPVRGLVQAWWTDSEHASGAEYVNFLVTGEDSRGGAWNRYVNGSDDSYLTRLVTYLIAHRADMTPTTTPEATITDTTNPTIVPIGPDHPGWVDFAARMAEIATRNSMCPEYDRIAREMGLPTRKVEIVTRVTIDVPVTIERGNNVDDRTLREAARALLEQNGTVSRANRTELRRSETVG